jgi:hypothetical protein
MVMFEVLILFLLMVSVTIFVLQAVLANLTKLFPLA